MELRKETLERAETVYGKRGATWLFHLAMAAFVCGAVGVIVLSASYVYSYVRPSMESVPTVEGYGNALIAIAVTILLFVIAGILARRYFQQWENVTGKGTDMLIAHAIEEHRTEMLEILDTLHRETNEKLDALSKRIQVFETEKITKEFVQTMVQRAMAKRLTIHKAEWGAAGKWSNVTNIIRAVVRDDKVDLAVENASFGWDDPVPTHDKVLKVVYQIGDGPKQDISFKEHERARLPPTIPGTLGDLMTR